VILATVGLGFLALNDNLSLNKGDLLVLACAFSFAIHIILVGKYAPKMDTSVLTTIQIGVSALGSWIFRLTAETFSVTISSYVIVALLITGIMATALAFSLQNLAQKFTTPTHTALIFTTEPVFAALFAYLLAAERLTLRGWIGAVLILLGMILAEVRFDKLLSRRRLLVTEED